MRAKEFIVEANPKQQAALYKPDGTTYRQEKMPTYDPDDMYSRRAAVPIEPEHIEKFKYWNLDDPKNPEDSAEQQQLHKMFQKGFEHLNDNERRVLELRFYEDETLLKTAELLGLTPERRRQIEAKALRKLRQLEMFRKEPVR
jgi:RNA polymerase sigma factor (sigma-70 family)